MGGFIMGLLPRCLGPVLGNEELTGKIVDTALRKDKTTKNHLLSTSQKEQIKLV